MNSAVFDYYAFFVLFGIASIAVHEWAHILYLRRLGRDTKLRWINGGLQAGTEKDYQGLSRQQVNRVYLIGIYTGFIPIIIGSLLFHKTYLLILLPYIAWCKSDIKNIWRNRT
jgi:hypothetical protein